VLVLRRFVIVDSNVRNDFKKIKGTKVSIVVTLIKPENSSLHDVFIQRMNGGKWTSKIDGNYEIPTSDSVMQIINFYDSDESTISKDTSLRSRIAGPLLII